MLVLLLSSNSKIFNLNVFVVVVLALLTLQLTAEVGLELISTELIFYPPRNEGGMFSVVPVCMCVCLCVSVCVCQHTNSCTVRELKFSGHPMVESSKVQNGYIGVRGW